MSGIAVRLGNIRSSVGRAGPSDNLALWLEKERLAADLTASVGDLEASRRDLEASRRRLSGAADEERRRIQRDLHDGAQQHLIGMQVKVALALEASETDPARCKRLLGELDEQIAVTLNDLRSLASGVFPPVLTQYGLTTALRAELRRTPTPVRLEARGVGRHPSQVESAVYFSCLEALQNVAKHAGRGAEATLRLWQHHAQLGFELRDSGKGFDLDAKAAGSGLHNMRDRLESIGGRLTVESLPGCGTLVMGVVPIQRFGGVDSREIPVRTG
jgi:signal transduction histidine kinase